MLSETQDLARRLEQQLIAYEKMHADEIKRFQEQLANLQSVQSYELQMLRDELAQLKQELAALKEQEPEQPVQSAPDADAPRVEMTITRRELLTGNLRPRG